MSVSARLDDSCPGLQRCRMRRAVDCWSASAQRAESCLRAAAEAAVAAIFILSDLAVEREEVIQDVMIRAVGEGGAEAMMRVRPACYYLTWLKGIARNCVRERLRRHIRVRRARPVTWSLDALAFPEGEPAWQGLTPLERAALRDSLVRARAFADELPPPCDAIARFLACGLGHGDISKRLRDWRPVGTHECRRLIRLTKAMLRALDAGEAPRPLWPAGWDREKNSWFSLPPPPRKVTSTVEAVVASPEGPRGVGGSSFWQPAVEPLQVAVQRPDGYQQ